MTLNQVTSWRAGPVRNLAHKVLLILFHKCFNPSRNAIFWSRIKLFLKRQMVYRIWVSSRILSWNLYPVKRALIPKFISCFREGSNDRKSDQQIMKRWRPFPSFRVLPVRSAVQHPFDQSLRDVSAWIVLLDYVRFLGGWRNHAMKAACFKKRTIQGIVNTGLRQGIWGSLYFNLAVISYPSLGNNPQNRFLFILGATL